ncbi:hypothetical protein GCM10027436_15480 [Actinophytocola sediminis]
MDVFGKAAIFAKLGDIGGQLHGDGLEPIAAFDGDPGTPHDMQIHRRVTFWHDESSWNSTAPSRGRRALAVANGRAN